MPRLAIISTHPIQYNAPWFAMLAMDPDLELKVFYTWSQRQTDLFDQNFGKSVEWDIPLLEGYDYSFVENTSRNPGNNHFSGIVCPTLNQEISAWCPTHLLVFGWNFQAHFKAMRHFKGKIPVLFRGDSTLLDERGGAREILRRIILTLVYRFIDLALYTGNSNHAYFRKHGLKNAQLVFAPHAIDNDRFIQGDLDYKKQSANFRKKLNIEKDDMVILFVGKFETKKNPLLLLKVFKMLLKDERKGKLRLLFVGNGVLEKQLREEAYGMEEVCFADFQNQSLIPSVYRAADVLCLPSSGPGESWGLVVNEAMACGVKCVISDKAGCAANLGDYTGNEVFRSGDCKDLEDKLNKALYSPKPDNIEFLSIYSYEHIRDSIKGVISLDE